MVETAFLLNVSIPDVQGSIFEVVEDKWVIGGVAGKQNQTAIVPGHIWTISLKRGQEGTLLSNVTFTPPKQVMDTTEYYIYGPYATTTPGAERMQGPFVYSDHDVFVMWEGATRQLWGFSLTTGQQIWGPTEPQDVWMVYGISLNVVDGILYTSTTTTGPGGEIHAYDITTGVQKWTYFAGTTNFETPY